MNYTQNCRLNQWEAADKVQRTDFNADNAKIDAALAAQAQTLTAQGVELARKGNCQVSMYTYTGTGTYGADAPTVITFPEGTFLLCIISGTVLRPLLPGITSMIWSVPSGGHTTSSITWTATSMSISSQQSSDYQFNGTHQYAVLSFQMADRP